MPVGPLPPLPGVDSSSAPPPEDPGFGAWLERAVHSPEGIDRALIWESLHRTPAERLAALQDYVDTFHARSRAHPLR
jgi:hypothetical protein